MQMYLFTQCSSPSDEAPAAAHTVMINASMSAITAAITVPTGKISAIAAISTRLIVAAIASATISVKARLPKLTPDMPHETKNMAHTITTPTIRPMIAAVEAALLKVCPNFITL